MQNVQCAHFRETEGNMREYQLLCSNLRMLLTIEQN